MQTFRECLPIFGVHVMALPPPLKPLPPKPLPPLLRRAAPRTPGPVHGAWCIMLEQQMRHAEPQPLRPSLLRSLSPPLSRLPPPPLSLSPQPHFQTLLRSAAKAVAVQ